MLGCHGSPGNTQADRRRVPAECWRALSRPPLPPLFRVCRWEMTKDGGRQGGADDNQLRGEKGGEGEEGVRHREEWRESEKDGKSCHESLTHSYCSGYRTELRGTELMHDSRRTITVLQTRISLIIWERMEQFYTQWCLNDILLLVDSTLKKMWLFRLNKSMHLVYISPALHRCGVAFDSFNRSLQSPTSSHVESSDSPSISMIYIPAYSLCHLVCSYLQLRASAWHVLPL